MTDKEARECIRKMLDIWPQVKNYWSASTSNKTAVYESWIRALCKRDAADLYQVLDDWEFIDCDKTFIASPVQTIIQLADAAHRRNSPKPRMDPPNREPRETNMLESFNAGLAAKQAGADIGPILEAVL